MSGTTGTPRTQSYLLGSELQDGQPPGSISPQDIRDMAATVFSRSFVSVEQYGAVGDGVADDTAAINSTIQAAITNGYGTILFSSPAYGISGSGIVRGATGGKIKLIGFGATLKALANNTTLVGLNNLSSDTATTTIEGFNFSANSHTGVTGIQLRNTSAAVVREIYISGCAYGIQFINIDAGKWCESCSVYDAFINACTVGIDFQVNGGTVSFNQCSLVNVGVNNCTTGIYCESGASMVRSLFENVTIWLFANQTGMSLVSLYWEGARWNIGFEAFSSTGTTCIATSGTFTYGAQNGLDNEIRIGVADNNPPANVVTGSVPFVYRNGILTYSVNSGGGLNFQVSGESVPRMKLFPGANGTIQFGNGLGTFYSLACNYNTNQLTWPGTFLVTGGLGVGNSAAATSVGTLSKKMQVFDASGTSIGYVPIYTTIT